MRRAAIVLIHLVLMSALAQAAVAQGKDPFLPPPGAGPGVSTGADQAPNAVPPPEPASGDRLARTGQDVSLQIAFGLALLAFGCALRMAERGMALAGRAG